MRTLEEVRNAVLELVNTNLEIKARLLKLKSLGFAVEYNWVKNGSIGDVYFMKRKKAFRIQLAPSDRCGTYDKAYCVVIPASEIDLPLPEKIKVRNILICDNDSDNLPKTKFIKNNRINTTTFKIMKKQNDRENQTFKLIQEKIKYDSESDIIDSIDTLPFYEVFEEELYEIGKKDWEEIMGEVEIEEDPDIEIEVNTYYADDESEFYYIDINDWPQSQ
jgi:hypothetical protein